MSGFCEVDFADVSSDAERVEFYCTTHPTARKEHKCSECREMIQGGQTYWKISYKFEGTLSVDRYCESCREAMAEFEYRIFGGSFWAEMREQWDSGANVQGCINRLTTVAAKELMRRQWLKWRKL